MVLETDSTTTPGTMVVDNNVYSDVGFMANTLYCVNVTSGSQRDVTEETYNAFEKLKTRIGWWATLAIFVVTMILFLVFQPALVKKIDRIIGYQPQDGK
ncbi:hypothetical protein [Candidatus Villigracilis affinis]|uniref:hypothetical protein n=1 Tax=Candidatus Villigracilis affinis TaxID=3140682 RepID=UPI002A1F72A9|nr:hypothetical protein [Anaerolineales bacterium]